MSTRSFITVATGGLLVIAGVAILPKGWPTPLGLILIFAGFAFYLAFMAGIGDHDERIYLEEVLERGTQMVALTTTLNKLVDAHYKEDDAMAIDLRMRAAVIDAWIANGDEAARNALAGLDGPWWKPPSRRHPKTTPAQEGAL